MAERFGVLPFDESLNKDLENPYRRAFYISLFEMESESDKRLRELIEILKTLFDVHGTSIFSVLGGKFKDGRKSLFDTGKNKGSEKVKGWTTFQGKKVKILSNF